MVIDVDDLEIAAIAWRAASQRGDDFFDKGDDVVAFVEDGYDDGKCGRWIHRNGRKEWTKADAGASFAVPLAWGHPSGGALSMTTCRNYVKCVVRGM
jgi:hypothetical protein